LLLASPAISASHEAAGSARVIPTTIEEGVADAIACVAAARDRIDFTELAARSSVLDRRAQLEYRSLFPDRKRPLRFGEPS